MLNKNCIRISQNTRRAIPSPRQFLTSFVATRSVRRSPECVHGAINSRRVRTRPPLAGRRTAMAHRDIHRGGAEPEQRVMPHVATVADHDWTSDVLDDPCESRTMVSASGTLGRITRLS
jgi:hypothetical protein